MRATPDNLPEFHPLTPIRDWGNGQAFRLADALTGVCVFGATGSGKTSGPAKHLAYGYLAGDFGGLVLCAKKEECRQWQQWAAETGRTGDLTSPTIGLIQSDSLLSPLFARLNLATPMGVTLHVIQRMCPQGRFKAPPRINLNPTPLTSLPTPKLTQFGLIHLDPL